jgi:Dolichyl-phosphate-mannose-protein mannosyltransferase
MTSTDRYLKPLRIVIVAALGIAATVLVLMSYQWPLQGDAQVFHYSHFLIQNGFAPYRDIPDINMPGVYLIEDWATHVFGGSDLGWRVYDFTLLAVLTSAMIVIARTYDWIAGLFAGVIFALAHGCMGPWNTAQRDEVMTVLILVAYAFLFEALRKHKPWMLFASGLSLGMASAIKPTVAPFGIVLLAMTAWRLRKEGKSAAAYMWLGVAGATLAGVLVLTYLVRYHAVGDFYYCARQLTSFYTGQDRASLRTMLRHVVPFGAAVILPFGIIVALVEKRWRNWERTALMVGVVFGAFSYFAQGKGYSYHVYPLAAMILLWSSLELMLAMRSRKWTRRVGIAGIAVGILIAIPTYFHRLPGFSPIRDDYTVTLQSDLTRLGGARLNHQVQCLDLIDGCFAALYHLRLVQSTGFMGDLLLFSPGTSPVIGELRETFWNTMSQNPPSVIVLSNETFYGPRTFNKINVWPSFAAYLKDNYHPVVDRTFPKQGEMAYRIYVRDGVSIFLNQQAAL